MKELGRYCTETQMFVEDSKVSMKALLFNRWLAVNQQRTLGVPTGEFALALSITTGLPVEQAVEGAFIFASQQELLRRKALDIGAH